MESALDLSSKTSISTNVDQHFSDICSDSDSELIIDENYEKAAIFKSHLKTTSYSQDTSSSENITTEKRDILTVDGDRTIWNENFSSANIHGISTSNSMIEVKCPPLPNPISASSIINSTASLVNGGTSVLSSARPFKMYPMDPSKLASGMFPIMSPIGPTTPHPAVAIGSGLFPFGTGISHPHFGLNTINMKNAISLCSPVANYLQNNKRPRVESKTPLELSDTHAKTLEDIDPETRQSIPTNEFLIGDTINDYNSSENMDSELYDGVHNERRRRNNEAAKRSRDTRRIKEEEIALRAALLEQENLKLRAQVAVLKNETTQLHCMLYQL